MPKAMEKKLEKQYGKGNPAVYATMNKMGVMKGNKIVKKTQVKRYSRLKGKK